MAGRTKPRFWLMKSEPDAYSIDDLARDKRQGWDGVRNFRARNIMRDEMKLGDHVLFYHSSTTPPGIVGLARVSREAHPDPSAWDETSKYYDPKGTPEDPRWVMVEVEFVEKFDRMVSLAALKEDPRFEGMWVRKRGMRLSVQPVEPSHARLILRLAGARSAPSEG